MAQGRRLSRVERSLLARCRQLDTGALHAVLYRHADEVYERLAARLRDRSRAEKAFEEVFRRFLDAAPAFNGSRTIGDHLRVITDSLVPASDVPPPAPTLAEAEFVDLVPSPDVVTRVEQMLLEQAPALSKTVRHANRRAKRQVLVGIIGLLVVTAAVLAARLTHTARVQADQVLEFASEAIVQENLVEEVRDWIRREELSPLHGEARRHDLEELRLVLEELASLKSSERAVELGYISQRLRERNLINFAYELSQEAATVTERRKMREIALVLEEVSVL